MEDTPPTKVQLEVRINNFNMSRQIWVIICVVYFLLKPTVKNQFVHVIYTYKWINPSIEVNADQVKDVVYFKSKRIHQVDSRNFVRSLTL